MCVIHLPIYPLNFLFFWCLIFWVFRYSGQIAGQDFLPFCILESVISEAGNSSHQTLKVPLGMVMHLGSRGRRIAGAQIHNQPQQHSKTLSRKESRQLAEASVRPLVMWPGCLRSLERKVSVILCSQAQLGADRATLGLLISDPQLNRHPVYNIFSVCVCVCFACVEVKGQP